METRFVLRITNLGNVCTGSDFTSVFTSVFTSLPDAFLLFLRDFTGDCGGVCDVDLAGDAGSDGDGVLLGDAAGVAGGDGGGVRSGETGFLEGDGRGVSFLAGGDGDGVLAGETGFLAGHGHKEVNLAVDSLLQSFRSCQIFMNW